jgi:hypothetical protein
VTTTSPSSLRRPPPDPPLWACRSPSGACGILAAYLGAHGHVDGRAKGRKRRVQIGRERLRVILRPHHISFQRTRTWKESTDPDKDAKLDRADVIE